MSGSDAILVGEGWISEHYFTSDATTKSFRARVSDRRRYWDGEAKDDRKTPRSRFTGARQTLEVALAGLDELSGADQHEAVEKIYEQLLDVLDIQGLGRKIERTGPLLRVTSPGIPGRAPLVIVLARPAATVEDALTKDEPTLLEPLLLDEGTEEFTSASRLVSALFRADEAPDLALILAGRWAVLAQQDRWPEGRYLAVDLQLVAERNDTKKGGEIDRALTCLSGESIAPDADGTLWWTEIFEESINHTVGVSKELREGVRLSIEIIGNDVVTRRAAQQLSPLPATDANELAKQALRFLYRILFLLYAEASPELGVLPVGAREYDEGYSLDRLRELVQVELANPREQRGTHLYRSLGVLFGLVNKGHHPPAIDNDESTADEGLTFNALRADLFEPRATAFIDEVGLSNSALQKVLAHLLLSKEKRGKDRGFISYAELGINQLGAVYEGLMSYTGFFAEHDLYEVAKSGDASKGSWMVPFERSAGIAASDFVKAEDEITGERKPVVHERGSFVFRLSGRERQQSASYYTPEVLTKFTVGQALEELLDQDGRTTTAAEILELTVCEPAMGSGAFAIEAVRQLAAEYLKRRQDELKTKIDPDEYPRRLQEVKAYLALHNVYGVDLNSTAVELAEISLWLDTMVAGLSAPWFGLHLRRGNSLIGARRAVYTRKQVTDKSWLTAVPLDVPLTSFEADIKAGRVHAEGVHHFLLPAEGWGATADAKEAAALAPDAVKRVKTGWSALKRTTPTRQQTDALTELAHRVETLWQVAYLRLDIAEKEVRRSIPVWEAGERPAGGAVQREQIEASLDDQSGAYRRLRRVMDAWTALWFWPLTEAAVTVDGNWVSLPTLEQWIAGLQALLGRAPELRKRASDQIPLSVATNWEELGKAEDLELSLAGAQPIDKVLREHPWLAVCGRVAEQQGFFHWNLDFATVFTRGGFDLQVGNPPWVRPIEDVPALLAEGDPWWGLGSEADELERQNRHDATLNLPGICQLVVDGVSDVAAVSDFVKSVAQYPILQGFQPDLYRCFMERTWRHSSTSGTIGIVHYETHFTDERAGLLRLESYLRLRQHWHFQNKLKLFREIKDEKQFGVTVYGARRQEPDFVQACWLYHPDTALGSLDHNGSGPEPGMKDSEGRWDLRPHRDRIIRVTRRTLAAWAEILESSDQLLETKAVFAVNRSTLSVLGNLSKPQRRVGDLDLSPSDGWHETADKRRGYFQNSWSIPRSRGEVILQGSHLFVATPLYKVPNSTMRNKDDWSAVDLEALGDDELPATSYRPVGSSGDYDAKYSHWVVGGERLSSRGFYRVAWRRRAANTGVRTLMSAIIPPGVAHVNTVQTLGGPDVSELDLLVLQSLMSSIMFDFLIRCVPKDDIRPGTISRLPWIESAGLGWSLALRTLRLNCISTDYSELWKSSYRKSFSGDYWTGGHDHKERRPLGEVGPTWRSSTLLRVAADRRQALLEIDALVALAFALSSDELCAIYRTQFPVLYGYDRNRDFYDANGRLVPNSVLTVWRKKGDRISEEERTATNQAGNTYTYELPFVTLDREKDMRQAYEHFERLLKERQ